MKKLRVKMSAIQITLLLATVCCFILFSGATPYGPFIVTVAGTGTDGYGGDGGVATSSKISRPRGIAVDSAGNLYIADTGNNRIRKVGVSGIITTIAGTGTEGYSGDGGPAASAEIYRPLGIALDSSGNLFFVDQANNRVRKVSASGIISTVAGSGAYGSSGDGGPAASAELAHPWGVAVDPSGNIYISEIDSQCIRKVDKAGIITTVVGDGTAAYNGDEIPAKSAEISNPTGLAVDSLGNLYICDNNNDHVRRVGASGIITTVAGGGTDGLGDGGPATSAELDGPMGVAVDISGNFYFSEAVNNRVRKVDRVGNITTVAGDGMFGYNGDSILAISAKLSTPQAISLDSEGNLYIADYNNQRIRKVLQRSQ